MNFLRRIREDHEVLIMGILNVTPDSFSDGGKFFDRERAVRRALEMEERGADIVDVGGESTRPGAQKVELEEELDRTIPVIEAVREEADILVSIDTYKSEVARRALDAGAEMVNDVSALRFDEKLAPLVAERNVPIVLMHMQGTPRTMQKNPTYEDPVLDIMDFLRERIEVAEESGISGEKVIVDPGIGFGKSCKDNYEILRRLEEFKALGAPLLLGTSRKSFLGEILDLPPEERVEGTIATNVVGVLKGARILRVHDVEENRRAVQVATRCQ